MATNNEEKLDKKEQRLQKKADKKAEKQADKARIREEKRQDREALFKVENPIAFMRIVNVISGILLFIALFLGIRYIINGVFLLQYKNGTYLYKAEVFLEKLNAPEGYLPYYNAGNAYYNLEDYDNAIDSYKSALESHPSDKKEADIRVNLALAMLHKIDFDNINTEKQKAAAVRTLQSARNVLCEKGHADPYGTDGRDAEAEQLKQDIDKMLEELDAEPEPPQESEEDEKNQGGSGSDEKEKSQREKQLEKELDDQKQENMQERQEAQDEADAKQQQGGSGSNSGSGGGSDFDGKTW